MTCGISFLVAIVAMVTMAYFYSATTSSQVAQKYEATLTPELRTHYHAIVAERQVLAYKGYGLGLILAIAYIWFHRGLQGKMKKIFAWGKLSNLSMVSIVVAMTFVTNYFYYVLSPKKAFMLNYLSGKEEIDNWTKMYREMQFNYHVGLLAGVISAAFVALAFRC